MRFRYVGAGADPPERTVFKGLHFERDGEPVEVTDADIVAKLDGNRCFERVDEDGAHIDDVEFDERDTLRARLRARGQTIDGRWGLERLRAEAASGNHG